METPHSSSYISLETGAKEEIVNALMTLGASPTIIAQASTSFLIKIPGAVISKIEGGFQVGDSKLLEPKSLALGVVNTFQFRAMAAANDNFHQKAA